METERAQLMTGFGRGTRHLPRAGLPYLRTPPATQTFTPVPHFQFVGQIVDGLVARGIAIEREAYAVMGNGDMLFGVMDLKYGGTGDGRAALGLRNANNKRLCLDIAVGHRVLVCDNLALSGDLIALHRRHTGAVDLSKEVEKALGRFMTGFNTLAAGIDRLQAQAITDDEAREHILRVLRTGIVPSRLIADVLHHYFEDPLPAFKPRTLWSLHNAFTMTFHELPPQPAFAATITLGQVLGLSSGADASQGQ